MFALETKQSIPFTGGMKVDGFIEGVPIQKKIDTGARNTFISEETFESLLKTSILASDTTTYLTADGSKVKCLGKAMMKITFSETVYETMVLSGAVYNNWCFDEGSFIINGSIKFSRHPRFSVTFLGTTENSSHVSWRVKYSSHLWIRGR